MSANPFLLEENKEIIVSRLVATSTTSAAADDARCFVKMSNHRIIYGVLG